MTVVEGVKSLISGLDLNHMIVLLVILDNRVSWVTFANENEEND